MQFQREALQIIADTQTKKYPEWANAIKKAFEQLTKNPEINLSGDTLTIESYSGKTYHVNKNKCQCPAFDNDRPCWHRAARALVLEYREKHPAASLIHLMRTQRPVQQPVQRLRIPVVAMSQAQAQAKMNELFA